MPLNKLENFIKNTEGKILYVNPNDLDATDSISNQGNSLAQPFKTIQRALLESARFSYVRGTNNDITEKTTILVYPGDHLIDNRPGFAIYNNSGTAYAVPPSGGTGTVAIDTLTLNLTSNFDLTQEDNILYKFNSIYGGIIIPRGTSIVGLDLRKTKIKPKYVPNPTDPSVGSSAIFRITGGCYFWQFTFFDGDENGLVYTDDSDFSTTNQAKPTFSHHKLTCFEYADGVNNPSGYDITDLDMYYSKLSNAFNLASTRDIDQKYPDNTLGFSKQRMEYEIVGAFASDPIPVSGGSIISGDGNTPGSVVTVTTPAEHGLNVGTPIKIKGVTPLDYNISAKVATVTSGTVFTYILPFVRENLPATPNVSSATITIETDTVSGASPYIFNCSLRSVFGMQGMKADGKKSAGFRSMVVAQFTGISLQKDDRAFVKYNSTSRLYDSIALTLVKGAALSSQSSSLDPSTVYHLDSGAIYRTGWETTHISIVNDAVLQVVSVFAIGYNKHFDAQSGGDASITNSNSNFGQISLVAEGFKKDAFAKDNKGFITSIITPKAITTKDAPIDWLEFDIPKTKTVGISSHLYLFGFEDKDDAPPILSQGYRVGAKKNDAISVQVGSAATVSANIQMLDNVIGTGSTIGIGTDTSEKSYVVTSGPTNNVFTVPTHTIQTGEKIRIFSDDGDLPENIEENKVYFAIRDSDTQIKLASTLTNATNGTAITVYKGTKLSIVSRVHDKEAGEIGSPVQYDDVYSQWFLKVATTNDVYTSINSSSGLTKTKTSFVTRRDDDRSLDDKIYRVRVAIPKELPNTKNPEESFIIQESSSTGIRTDSDIGLSVINDRDYDFNRNPRFISTCTQTSNIVTVISDIPHNLNVGDDIIIKNVTSSTNTSGTANIGFNGTFDVTEITNDKQFKYSTTDVDGIVHSTGTNSTNDVTVRNSTLPRFQRNDLKSNFYIYRSETISPHIENVQDGVYHLYILKADNSMPTEFTNHKYSQKVVDLYPQLDKDNFNDNPPAAVSFAKRAPLGEVVTNDLKKSITRESIDTVLKDFGVGLKIISVDSSAGIATVGFDREHSLSGISTGTITGGATYTNGTFQNVKLLNGSAAGSWNGATARIVVSGGGVSSVDIITGGSGYSAATLFFDATAIGSGDGNARYTITSATISNAINDTLQITGIGTTTSGHYRITDVPTKSTVAVAKTSGDPVIVTGQYGINVGVAITISSDTFDSTTGISTFTCQSAHGLVSGNKFNVVDTSNNTLGTFSVKEKISVTNFSAITNTNLAGTRILPNGLNSSNATSDATTESLGARNLSFYDNESFTLVAAIGNTVIDTTLRISPLHSGTATLVRLPMGSYIQIDNEIMRVVSSTLTGSGNDEITVIRGVLGSLKASHAASSIIKKIKPLPVEFRRPSILRASGHTFEYLGFGPGNYSTGLPQVQNRTLTEREEFLSQSQEKSGGAVVYTGMNNRGDFYIGNKRVTSTTGEETTFDAPTPTVTGQDPSRLSVIFDEIVVKERIIIEGGKSNRVLSQFDGPVTFNNEVKVNDNVTITGTLKINNTLEITDTTQSNSKDTGCYVIEGGMGIEKNANIGGNLNVTGISTFNGNVVINSTLLPDADEGAGLGSASLPWADLYAGEIKVAVTDDNTIDTATGNLTLNSAGGTTTLDDNVSVTGNLTVTGSADMNGGASIDNIQVGVTNDNEIDTSSGNLTIDSAGGTTTIDDNLSVSGTATISGKITGSDGAEIDNIRLGVTGNNEIDTSSGNLTIDSAGGTTTLDDNVSVSGSLTVSGAVNAGSNNFTGGGGTFGNIKVAITGDNEIDTSSGTLILDSASGTVQVTDILNVTGNTDLDGTLNVDSTSTFGNNISITGQGSFTGNVIAFVSDDRLKTNKVGITGALDKVMSLSGFTYNFNEMAGVLGYDMQKTYAGVSAQEVQKVLPEAVFPAPADDKYITVQYDRLVPLLIEAIKELKEEVEELKKHTH